MEDLNAQQIVLLTLLVSFVTSIATGITTVSLLEQAPEPITQTINRVVEKTVERVVEVKGDNNTTVERVVETVVVNAEDLTTQAISKNSDSLVRIFNRSGDLKTFVGFGIIISDTGNVLMDSRNISSTNDYVGQFVSGEKSLNISFREPNNAFAIMSIKEPSSEKFLPIVIGDSQSLKLGQSVISLSGQSNNTVSIGIVSSLDTVEVATNSDPRTVVNNIETSIEPSKIQNGSILLNLKGELIGMRIGLDQTKPSTFMPAQKIKDFISL
ncbi:MAG TPA: serine protease [Candidatus Paceibacterota bacterium]|mgnify:CR=1 FL=1|nr:serine protease [Candidatus Paceibacterota bacterium]